MLQIPQSRLHVARIHCPSHSKRCLFVYLNRLDPQALSSRYFWVDCGCADGGAKRDGILQNPDHVGELKPKRFPDESVHVQSP